MRRIFGVGVAALVLLLSACSDDDNKRAPAATGEGSQVRSFSALVDEAFKRSPDDEPVAVNTLDIQFADNQSFDAFLQN